MRNLLVVLSIVYCLILGTSSCGDPFDSEKCLMTVQENYPKAIVWKLPEKNFSFIVCDTNGGVYFVKTMDGNSTNITHKIVIKAPR